ncbi:DUF1800 domain-containing protein [Halomonas cupida]|uniref:DUF1800 family protein n=1 Tax=Halomonas TaxID=2745 RepID=UPI001A8CBCC6|nr:DUF1800 domain-containing protein [Halomonas litopenaei]
MSDALVLAEIAASRFGLGPRPGELEQIAHDPQGWVLAQLDAPQEALLGPGGTPLPSTLDYLERFAQFQRDHAEARRRMARQTAAGGTSLPRLSQRFGRDMQAERQARARQQCLTGAPVLERWVMFWSNHFCVSADRGKVVMLPGAYEREAIRPNITSRFSDLLLAVEQHPTMLLYLENADSVGPSSAVARAARRRASPRSLGLNENLAREILELHTLGVDGPYDQADVVALAQALTGWRTPLEMPPATNPPDLGSHGSVFHEAAHEPGPRILLGQRFAADGAGQGQAMLRLLAQHESTATFIARKLAGHFVADHPPAELVSALARSFRDQDGDLAELYRTLFRHPLAWQPGAPKFRRPEEFLVALYHALDKTPPSTGNQWEQELRLLGQRPFWPGSPAGWSDDSRDWIGADALYRRVALARRHGRDSTVEPLALAEHCLGPRLREETAVAISQQPPGMGRAMVLASPEFQWR